MDQDEDTIAYYQCVKCGANCCKDDVFKKIKDRKVICLSCGGVK